MCFPKMDDLPVVLAGHRIDIAFAKEADVVCVLKLVDGGWVAAEFLVIELDGARVLLSAMDQLLFAIALNACSDARSSHSEGDQDQHDHEKHGEQDVARFGFGGAAKHVD